MTLRTDDGNDETWYAIDDAGCAPTNTDTSHGCRSTKSDLNRPFVISAESRHTLFFFSEDVSGNAEALQTLPIWIDTTAPAIVAPPDLMAEATSSAGTPVGVGGATADDGGSGVVSIANDSPGVFQLGTTIVRWTALDAAGNSATATQSVTVVDTTPPELAAPPDVTVDARDGAGAVVPDAVLGFASASDLAGSVTISRGGVPAGNLFPVGDTFILYTATDEAGLQTSTAQRVTVRLDQTPPQLHLPAGIAVNATAPTGALVSYTASASDDLDPSPTVLCDRASGALFPIGTTTVNCTARDLAGNQASGSFTVTVKGAAEQLSDIRTAVQNLNLAQGIANSLDAKLQNLEQAISSNRNGDKVSTCNKLDAFVNEVSAQVQSGQLSQTQATPLIAAANRIKAVLGCA